MSFHSEPIHDVSNLGHVELNTPDLDASVRFSPKSTGWTW